MTVADADLEHGVYCQPDRALQQLPATDVADHGTDKRVGRSTAIGLRISLPNIREWRARSG